MKHFSLFTIFFTALLIVSIILTSMAEQTLDNIFFNKKIDNVFLVSSIKKHINRLAAVFASLLLMNLEYTTVTGIAVLMYLATLTIFRFIFLKKS